MATLVLAAARRCLCHCGGNAFCALCPPLSHRALGGTAATPPSNVPPAVPPLARTQPPLSCPPVPYALPHARPPPRASLLARLAEATAGLPVELPPVLPHAPGAARPRLAVGLSGGVDSALVAALALLRGYDVIAVHMRSWDADEEGGACDGGREREAAAAVAAALGLRLHDADFVRRYWTDVFGDMLSGYERGGTPNPDLACNRHIKFGALLVRVRGPGEGEGGGG